MDYRPENDPPSAPVTLPEIVNVLASEANKIEASQRALVASGHRTKPDPDAMRRAEVLDAARKVLEVVIPHWPSVREMLVRKRRGFSR